MSLRKLISLMISEASRYKKEKGEAYDAATMFRQYAYDPNAFVHYSDLNKLGLNPKSRFNTPIGIYGYPLEMFDIDDILKGNVPFAGDRKFIHLFTVKPEYINNLIAINSDGEPISSDIDFKSLAKEKIGHLRDKDNENELAKEDVEDKIKEFYSLVKKTSLEDKRSSIISAGALMNSFVKRIDDINVYMKSMMELVKFYTQEDIPEKIREFALEIIYLKEEYLKNMENINGDKKNYIEAEHAFYNSKFYSDFGRYWNVTRIISKGSKKWSQNLVKDGMVGVVDYGSGIVHHAEPMQAVFFSKAVIDHIATFEKFK